MKPQRRHAIGSSIGICEKDENLIVQYQNDLCLRICGDKLGSKCTHGCMKNYQRRSVEQGAACDYLVIERMETDLGIIDALVVEHSEGVTTLLFEKTETIAMQIKSLSGYGLSRAETKVVRRVLEGFSNTDIAKQLFISKQTLRTHLKNIYKKLPEDIKDNLLKATRRNRGGYHRG